MKAMPALILVLSLWSACSAQNVNAAQTTVPKKPANQEKQPASHHRKTATHSGYMDCQVQSNNQPGKTCIISIEWLAKFKNSQHDPIWLDHNDTVIWITTSNTPFKFGPFNGEDCSSYTGQRNPPPFDNAFDNDDYSTFKQAHFVGKKGLCWEHVIYVDNKLYIRPHSKRRDGDEDKDDKDKGKNQGRDPKQTIDPHIFGGSDGT